MNITIIGMGYVGLVAGVCFAEMGHTVIGLDIDMDRVDQLLIGNVPLYEPGLKELLQKNIAEGRISFTSSYRFAVSASLLIFLALPTPSNKDGSVNLSYIFSAAGEIAQYMDSYKLIINKSTAPVGTVCAIKNHIDELLFERGADVSFDVGCNPEFLKEGSALQDFLKPDRIIIGSDSETVREYLSEIYSGFILSRDRIIHMSIRAAELTKYVSNAMLSCRISFMNEIAGLCEAMQVNIQDIRKGLGSDSRIGPAFLYAGVGFGGSCFPKDLRALRGFAKKCDVPSLMLDAIWQVNIHQKAVLYEKLRELFYDYGGLSNKVIAIWGLAFKPDTDDMREAPSLDLIQSLQKSGSMLQLFDPVAMSKAKLLLPSVKNLIFCSSEKLAATGADAVCLVTEWKQFRYINMRQIYSVMRRKFFLDGRNQYCPDNMKKLGFIYSGIGTCASPNPSYERDSSDVSTCRN
ncbi:MAG: UDP-glucose dehydrogenase family protein [Chlamydiales bacterium]